VLYDADELTDAQMHDIAREFELSETAFVVRADAPDCDWRVRIWTPYEEVSVAGHPLVGAALVLERMGRAGERMVLQTNVGGVPMEVKDGMAWMGQPEPEFGAIHEDRVALAAAHGLEPTDLRSDIPAQIVSCGHEFLFVPVASLDAMRRIKVRLDAWDPALVGYPPFTYCFSEETEAEDMAAHCRLLAPHDIASGEDAASGSAAAPLAAYLWQYVHGREAGEHRFAFEQGIEMGRPSELLVSLAENGESLSLSVGGQATRLAAGEFELPDS
jgi:trans-2,3-dihydro-3-hydroxyanthranilate isomerase